MTFRSDGKGMNAPMAIDLYAGLGGWTSALMAEGWFCVGFDIEQHVYGEHRYPGHLVIQDVLTLHGSQFRDAELIVASPPCQRYSYMAMPWKRAKALPPPDNTLFEVCFRIQREACEAAGRHIPLIVENVRGAQKWVGAARWNFGSFYLWGDVPAIMPDAIGSKKGNGPSWNRWRETGEVPPHWTMTGIKQPGIGGPRNNGKGDAWFQDGAARHGSKSSARKAASAMIAKIPYPLARHIARTFYPRANQEEA